MSRSVTIRNPGANDGIVLTFDGSTVTFANESDGSAMPVANATAADAAAVASLLAGFIEIDDLTEASGDIGGTSDGDLPDLSSPDATKNAAAVRELAEIINTILANLRLQGVIGTP
jgi:hypothetical protein